MTRPLRGIAEETVKCARQAYFQLLQGAIGVGRKAGTCPEVVAGPLPSGIRQEERLEAAEVLRPGDGQIGGANLVDHLEEQGALPTAAVHRAVMANERTERLRDEVDREAFGQCPATVLAKLAVRTQRLERGRLAPPALVEELHPAQERRGEPAQGRMPPCRFDEPRWAIASRPVRQLRVVFAKCLLGHHAHQSGAQFGVVDAGIEQHAPEGPVSQHDPVDGVALRLELLVQAAFDLLAIALEQLGVHVHRLIERVAPRLAQEAHQRQAATGGQHLS